MNGEHVRQAWLEAYLDGETSGAQETALREHLASCAACALVLADAARMKRSVRLHGQAFSPSEEFRALIAQRLSAKPQAAKKRAWWMPATAGLAALILAAVLVVRFSGSARESELAEAMDLHVTALASGSPVEVVSSDRHTVKPWFQGRLPFAFNLPELAGTPYTLIGGRVAYLHHEPCAQLIYGLQAHRISVFACQGARGASEVVRAPLRGRAWNAGQLSLSAVTDTDPKELENIERMWRAANP